MTDARGEGGSAGNGGKCRIAEAHYQFYEVKRMIRGLGEEISSTYSQTLNM
jgi:hypothetical protein